MKLVFLDADTIDLDGDMDFSGLPTLGSYTSWPMTSPEELPDHAGDAEAVIVNKVRLGRADMEALPKLKHIAVIATGVDNVDLTAARERGIRVTNVGGYGKYTVPQHAFTLILALADRLIDYAGDVARGDWQQATSFTLLRYPTFELAGKTLGIIGFGAIGRGAAEIATGFRMRVLAHDLFPFEYPPYTNQSLETVLKHADVVTIHAPLTEETRNLIGPDELATMKPGALLVNTGRGGIVDEAALLHSLESGHLGGAALDVLAQEPPQTNPLIGRTDLNLIITPHSAWSAQEARQRLIDGVVANVRAWQQGRDRNVVA
ncbi:MAG: D-2-hydroxyacid dehydrogenase [Spirochaeta sp.]|jgi:glycerate dehydrogenase|nr:D-2-hydroxyacid dehydrogenase [Spirochaeta sp.]